MLALHVENLHQLQQLLTWSRAEKHDGEYFQSFFQLLITEIFMFICSLIAEVDWALSALILVNVVCKREKDGGGVRRTKRRTVGCHSFTGKIA